VSVTGLLLVAALLPAAGEEGYTAPALSAGAVRAVLTVRVAGPGPAPGLARVHLAVTVTGPAALLVEPLRPEDSLAAWKVRWHGSGWALGRDGVTWEQTVEIVQTRPGVIALPAVRVAYRSAPGARREAFRWDDLLREPRDVPDIEDPPAPPPPVWPARLRLAGAVLAVLAVLLALVVVARRRLRRPAVPLTAHERALARLVPGALPAEDEPAAYHDHLAAVLRDYLAERFGLSPARTTAELLGAAEAAGLDGAVRALLGAVLAECDLVKFAGARPGPQACRATASKARELVSAIRPPEQAGEGRGAAPVPQAGRAEEESRAG
jgi:hypothetical protein